MYAPRGAPGPMERAWGCHFVQSSRAASEPSEITQLSMSRPRIKPRGLRLAPQRANPLCRIEERISQMGSFQTPGQEAKQHRSFSSGSLNQESTGLRTTSTSHASRYAGLPLSPRSCTTQPSAGALTPAAQVLSYFAELDAPQVLPARARAPLPLSPAASPMWPSFGVGVAERYETVSASNPTSELGVGRAARPFEAAVDWAESQVQRPFDWAVEMSRGVPGLELHAQGQAWLGRHGAQLLGGVAKEAGAMLLGAAGMVAHPVDTVTQLAEMGVHLPGMPFWLARHGYLHAKSLYDAAAHGAGFEQVAATLDLPAILKEDAAYWKTAGLAVASPYREALRQGKPMEAVGRGLFAAVGLLAGAGDLATARSSTRLSELTQAKGFTGDAAALPKTAGSALAKRDVGLSELGVRPGPGERTQTRAQYRQQASRARAEAATAAADLPLENPNPNAAQHGHGHARHGWQTTEAQQAERVETGRCPDQLPHEAPGKPAARASHFSSPEAEAEALGRARRALEKDLKAGKVEGFLDPVTGARTYVNPVDGQPMRHDLIVATNRPGGFGTSQVVRRQSPPSESLALDPTGKRVAVPSATPLPDAYMRVEYVSSTRRWRPVTYYPQPRSHPNGMPPLR